ncbi:unnamed protein product, partial [Timema podura]|nr:unnamed protein product [Timema podura]
MFAVKCQCIVFVARRSSATKAANSTLSATRFRQRLLIAHRYFVALGRHLPPENNHQPPVKSAAGAELRRRKFFQAWYTPDLSVDSLLVTDDASQTIVHPCFVVHSAKSGERATISLAKVGSRAAMNFSFAFLRRAWRSGEDTDLCSELLTESLDALHSLPEATLFDESSVSPVWLEVVDRSDKFLRQVVL